MPPFCIVLCFCSERCAPGDFCAEAESPFQFADMRRKVCGVQRTDRSRSELSEPADHELREDPVTDNQAYEVHRRTDDFSR